MAGIRDRVGVLCGQLSKWDTLDGIIRAGGAAAELDELSSTVASAATNADAERTAALLDAIEEACAKQGLVSVTGRGTAYRPLPTSFSANTAAWVCPSESCHRVVLLGETKTDPVCGMAGGTAMKRFQVPS